MCSSVKHLTNIRRDNLVNKTNEKGMLVSVKFVKNGVSSTPLKEAESLRYLNSMQTTSSKT